jgi:hypothetical protein
MNCPNLSTAVCPSCGAIIPQYYANKLTTMIDNFMPDITATARHSKKTMQEITKSAVFSNELPDAKFWNDVKQGKVKKENGKYVRKSK